MSVRKDLIPSDRVRGILEEVGARGCGMRRVAAIAEVPLRHLQGVRWRALVPEPTAAAVIEAYEDGLLIGPQDQPVDEVILEQLLAGKRAEIPFGAKCVYARELYRRGWKRHHVAKALRSSFASAAQWAQEAS